MSDPINPRHYKSHASKVEAIEICGACSFCLGNAIKYLFRADHKGKPLEDLQKTLWYLRRATEYGNQYWLPESTYAPVNKVISHEPPGSVLRDVLQLLLITDNLSMVITRVEQEIEYREEKQKP